VKGRKKPGRRRRNPNQECLCPKCRKREPAAQSGLAGAAFSYHFRAGGKDGVLDAHLRSMKEREGPTQSSRIQRKHGDGKTIEKLAKEGGTADGETGGGKKLEQNPRCRDCRINFDDRFMRKSRTLAARQPTPSFDNAKRLMGGEDAGRTKGNREKNNKKRRRERIHHREKARHQEESEGTGNLLAKHCSTRLQSDKGPKVHCRGEGGGDGGELNEGALMIKIQTAGRKELMVRRHRWKRGRKE